MRNCLLGEVDVGFELKMVRLGEDMYRFSHHWNLWRVCWRVCRWSGIVRVIVDPK